MMIINKGQKATRSMTLTETHVRRYAELSGDYNPIHFDKDFAAKTKFGKLVVQGGLTTGLLHALVATDLPGPGTVFLSQNWKFTNPVYIGDTITAEAVVLKVHDSKPVTHLEIKIRRQDGEVVLEGEAIDIKRPQDAIEHGIVAGGGQFPPLAFLHLDQTKSAGAIRACCFVKTK